MTTQEKIIHQDDGSWRDKNWSTADTMFWLLENGPTIGRLREMNRESLLLSPLGILNAISKAGFNLDQYADATVTQFLHEGEIIDMRYSVSYGNRLMAIVGIDNASGDWVHFIPRAQKGTEMAGLQRILKLYGQMKVGELLWYWDYSKNEPVKADDMPVGSDRWKESEKAKWTSIKPPSQRKG